MDEHPFTPRLRTVARETAAELAGFVDAARFHVMQGAGALAADLDWPTYADRHRQQPWFMLAALTLAGHGVRVLTHGIPGDSEGSVTVVTDTATRADALSTAFSAMADARSLVASLGSADVCLSPPSAAEG